MKSSAKRTSKWLAFSRTSNGANCSSWKNDISAGIMVMGRTSLVPKLLLATPDEQLRTAGLSRSKIAALKDLASKTIDGTVPSARALSRMSDDEIIARLTMVRGIGRWTVEMLLLFDLGRPDVWPVDDYGVRKGFAKTFGRRKLPTPKQLIKSGEKWRPYRSVAAWYFWRALEAPEKLRT